MNELPQKIEGTNIYPTLNARGGVTDHFDQYIQAFIDYCKTVQKPVSLAESNFLITPN